MTQGVQIGYIKLSLTEDIKVIQEVPIYVVVGWRRRSGYFSNSLNHLRNGGSFPSEGESLERGHDSRVPRSRRYRRAVYLDVDESHRIMHRR